MTPRVDRPVPRVLPPAPGGGTVTYDVATGVLVVERRLMPMTLNKALGASGKAVFGVRREIERWREFAYGTALRDVAGLQLPVPVYAAVHHLRRGAESIPDCGAPAPAAKAMIDGLVDALVLPGDRPEHVQRLTYESPLIVGWHGLRVTLTPVPADEIPPGHPSRQETLIP